MSDIDKYLARVVPWPSATLHGFVNVHWPFKGAHGPSMPGRAFQEFRSAVGFVNGMLRNPNDLYLCMSVQATAKPPSTGAKGRREKRGAIRSATTAVALRCFFLDIDIKDGKYRDTTHALTAFGEWRRKVGLPLPSLVVMSGSGGFHVYWVLHEPIPLATWLPVAEALKAACQQHGFETDQKVTANAAVLLRIPGTYNQKHTPPRLAHIAHEDRDYAFNEIADPLVPYRQAYAPGVTPAAPRLTSSKLGRPSAVFQGVSLPGRLDAGIEHYVPTIEEVADECPFIDATLQTGGRLNWEPLWRESLRVAAFVQDGEEVAHELSNGHIGYAEAETDKKYAEVEANKQKVGWPQCRAIHDAGAQECKSCPHLPKGRSPLNFAVPKAVVAAAAAAAIAVSSPAPVAGAPSVQPITQQELPAGYGQRPNGRIYKLVPDPQDPAKPATPVDILPLPILNLRAVEKSMEGGDYGVTFDCEVAPSMVRSVHLTYAELGDQRTATVRMAQQGLNAQPHEAKLTKEFMVSFTQQLANAKSRIIECKPYGWSYDKDGTFNGFCFARHRWNGTTTAPVQPLDREIDDQYTPRGNFQTWKDAARLVTDQQRPELDAIIGASYGAPLTKHVGWCGSVVHAWSPDSGTGKSTALHVAQAVWGTTSKMSKIADTPNAVNSKLGMLRNIPLPYDELKKASDKRLVELIMQIQQGSTKNRLTRSSQLMPIQTWHTLMIACSNSSLQGYISDNDSETVAGINRVFEYRVHDNKKGVGLIMPTKAQRMIGDLQDHYGHAGLEYAKYLGANYDKVKEIVERTQDAVYNAVQGSNEDRFWVGTMAAILCGARFANHLGHTNIDLDRLTGFMVEQLQEQRGHRKQSVSNLVEPGTVERLLADFIGAHRDRMLLTDRTWRSMGHPPQGWTVGQHNVHDLRGNVVARASKDGFVRITISALAGWTKKERDLGRSQIVNAITDAIPGAKVIKADIGHGTGVKVARQDVLELDLGQMPGFFTFD